jgi:hypothetical protein
MRLSMTNEHWHIAKVGTLLRVDSPTRAIADIHEEDMDNARLIAAAPKLLEACEQAEYWLTAERDNPGQASPKEILRVLATAIAKARP